MKIMRKIRIGIDCDGVLRDFIGKTIDLCHEDGVNIDRPTDWDYINTVKVDGKTINEKIWETEEWLEDVFTGAEPLPFAKKGYEAFVNDPLFEVFVVTSQREGTEFLTAQWLKSMGFDRHQKTYYLFDKLESPTQIIIDDKPSHILDFQGAGREGYLVKSSHNMDSLVQPQVENLYDAYEKITKRYKEAEVV